LSALVALVSTAAAAVTLSRRALHVRAAIGVLALLAVITAAGSLRVAGGSLVKTGTVLRVGLVQGNIEQNAKWNPAFRDQIVERYLGLSRQVLGAGAQLVLWPEAATPFFFDADSNLAEPIRRLAAQSRTPFLIGTDDFEKGQNGQPNRIYNAAVVIGSDGRSRGTYRKMVLVPFGEYVPFQRLLFFIGPLVQAVSDFSPGTDAFVFDADGQRISASICYESIYPWLSRAFVEQGSQLLTTITNDAWFGPSSAPYQHFEQGAVRAVEEGRYIARAANTGISGVVDPYGRVVVTTRLFEPAALVADVRLLDGRTIYSHIGDVVVWLSLAVTGLALVLFRRR
jgi:apolipoprotein N-acyltransferase